MPDPRACLIVAAVLFAATVHGADRTIYTWTDDRGNLHMTDEPPPTSAKVREVETYQERPPEEIEAIERTKERLEEQVALEEREAQAARAQQEAATAEKSAAAAIERAEELTRDAQEYARRFGNTPERRQQFKYKIQARKEMALAAQEAARAAVERADQAKSDARAAAAAVEKARNQPPPQRPEDLQISQ